MEKVSDGLFMVGVISLIAAAAYIGKVVFLITLGLSLIGAGYIVGIRAIKAEKR